MNFPELCPTSKLELCPLMPQCAVKRSLEIWGCFREQVVIPKSMMSINELEPEKQVPFECFVVGLGSRKRILHTHVLWV